MITKLYITGNFWLDVIRKDAIDTFLLAHPKCLKKLAEHYRITEEETYVRLHQGEFDDLDMSWFL